MEDKPDSSSAPGSKSEGASNPKTEDIYEFKTTALTKEGPPSSRTVSPGTDQAYSSDKTGTKEQQGKDDKKQPGEKRGHDNDDDEETRKKKQRREEMASGSTGPAASAAVNNLKEKSVRGTRGGSTEKVLSAKVGGAKARALVAADRKSPLSVTNSPKKAPSRDHSDDDDDSSKKSTDSLGLKVPPLKIVLSNQGNGNGNGSSNAGLGSNPSGATPSNPDQEQKKTMSGTGGDATNSSITEQPASNSTASGAASSFNFDRESRPTSSYTDYHVKKRKLRSQVEDSASSGGGGGNGSSGGTSGGGGTSGANPTQVDSNKNALNAGNGNAGSIGGSGNGNRPSSEPLNDIEKYLNIRRQVEQRRKNLFPVQPKPPQGFKDYLMNRKTYLLHDNAHERLRSIPMIQPPPSLEGPLRELFKSQEEERYKLRMKHLVEKEKLVLAVEQEILRVHGRAARALANQSLPYSVCTFLRDEEIYTPIDPQQEEKNRDIRSRYNGRLFLSWLQDVDDKWEKIKEQMVLRHHNEAESLNAVQKMDWEWKLKELCGTNPTNSDALPPIDDLHIPMVHVSDDFDLDRT